MKARASACENLSQFPGFVQGTWQFLRVLVSDFLNRFISLFHAAGLFFSYHSLRAGQGGSGSASVLRYKESSVENMT